jgi:hypothetical protein
MIHESSQPDQVLSKSSQYEPDSQDFQVEFWCQSFNLLQLKFKITTKPEHLDKNYGTHNTEPAHQHIQHYQKRGI